MKSLSKKIQNRAYLLSRIVMGGFFLFNFLLCKMSFSEMADASFCEDTNLDKIPILSEGRVSPFFAYTKGIRKQLFTGENCENISSSTLYCLLSIGKRSVLQEKYGCLLQLKIENPKVRELLAVGVTASGIEIDRILEKQSLLMEAYHSLVEKGDKSSDYSTALARILTRLEKLKSIETGSDWLVLSNQDSWQRIGELKQSKLDFKSLVHSSPERLTQEELKSLKIEGFYERLRPFEIAIPLCLFVFLCLLISLKVHGKGSNHKLLILALVAALLLIEGGGMALRILVAGRAPVTNMYETVMIVGLGSLFLGFILSLKLNDYRILGLGLFSNVLCLFMMKFATNMLDHGIEPLVPVLRDNFWLSTHVTSVTLSYACFTLSWIISDYVLIRWLIGQFKLLKPVSINMIQDWNRIIRICIQIGCVFLAAGVILGGIWADYSWGRFWGWDPKETWSLIALIVYIVVLHGRYAGWFKDLVFTAVASAGYLAVLMTWFGVNYILAVGLHSYGFSTGGTTFLCAILLIQLFLLGLTAFKIRTLRS